MTATSTDEESRRSYWTQQLELGFNMVQQLLAFPVSECNERFASIPEAAKAAGVEMLFSTSKIAGNLDRVFRHLKTNSIHLFKLVNLYFI